MKKKQRIQQKKIRLLPYLLILPSLLLYICFTYFPFGRTVVSSFAITTETGKFLRWAGLTNWIRTFNNPLFWKVLKNTFLFAGMNFAITIVVGMIFALLSVNKRRGSRIYQTLYALPMAAAAAPMASIWIFVFRENAGVLNQLLGTEIAWLHDTKTVLASVGFATAWGHVASRYIYLLVGFRNVPDDLLEAATIDGAGKLTRIIKIMLPMASPQIFFVIFLDIVTSFKTFTQIRLLGAGGKMAASTTLMYEVYQKASINGQFEYASCYAIVLFLIIFIVTRIQFLFEKRMVYYQ